MTSPLPGAPAAPYSSAPRRRRVPWVFLGVVAVLAGVGVLLVLISLYPAFFGLHASAQGFPYGGGGIFGAFLILWAVLLSVRIAWRMNRWSGSGGPGGPGRRDPALFIARRRYARGEISREQYEQIVRDLGRPPGAP